MKTFYIFECYQKLLDRIYPSISSIHILSSSISWESAFLTFKIKKKSGVFLLSFGNYVTFFTTRFSIFNWSNYNREIFHRNVIISSFFHEYRICTLELFFIVFSQCTQSNEMQIIYNPHNIILYPKYVFLYSCSKERTSSKQGIFIF